MNAGRLRSFVTFETDEGAKPAQGEHDWQPYCQRSGEVRELDGQELVKAQQIWPQVTTEIRLRADSETALITPKMRARFSDRFGNEKVLDIEAVLDETGRGIELRLKCMRQGVC